MTIFYIYLFAVIIVLLVTSTFYMFRYRSLCAQLSKRLRDMYCKETGCTNLRYYSTPVDDHKGVMTDYCSIHLIQRLGHPDGN